MSVNVNMQEAEAVEPQKVSVKDPTMYSYEIGEKVLKIILWIIAGFLFFSLLLIALRDIFIEMDKDERANDKEFYLDMFQVVLLNLFLPIVTAIVGYIFGNRDLRKRTAQE